MTFASTSTHFNLRRATKALLLSSMLAATLSSASAADMVSKAQKSVAGATSNAELGALQSRLQGLKAEPMQVLPAKTRQQVMAEKAGRSSQVQSFRLQSFSFYDAYSRLFEDIDRDGYYSTFSVTFDADLHSFNPFEEAVVYGELYLSRNGGDWVHYYTTDPFIITGDSPNDDYEVLTTLERGYRPGEYDVLIDLYEVGYSDIVATISSLETDELYGLPLESLDWDEEYESSSDGHGGGALGTLALLGLALVAFGRRLTA